MSTVLEQILEQAESLSRDDIRRLVKHLEWLAERPEPLNRVGHRLEDVLGFREEILVLAQAHGVGNVRVFSSVARGRLRRIVMWIFWWMFVGRRSLGFRWS